MQLTELLLYDITGSKESFKRENIKGAIYTSRQLVSLDEPAFTNTIKVYRADSNFNKGEVLTLGTDYTFDSCQDYDSESKARVIATSYPYIETSDTVVMSNKVYYYFNNEEDRFDPIDNLTPGTPIPENSNYFETLGVLSSYPGIVNKIQFLQTTAPSQPMFILMEYQVFKKNASLISGDGEGPVYTPGLMRSVIETLNEIKTDKLASVSAVASKSIRCLEEDLTGRKEDNFIQEEEHVVDTTTNRFIIRPACGSFYRYTGDDLKVVNVATGAVLKQETGDGTGDYTVDGVNFKKTAVSEPTGGVYEFIIMKKALVGTVKIDYHAFGGEVSIADINDIMDRLIALQAQFGNSNLLTINNLSKSTLIANVLDRLEFLEHQLQHYRTQTFMYRTSREDTWVDVAYIRSNAWKSDAPLRDHDTGKFQITIQKFDANGITGTERSSVDLEYKFSYEAVRNSQGAISDVCIKTKEMHMTHPMFNNLGMLYFDKRMTPKFRVVSNAKLDGSNSFDNGLMLQMAITSCTSSLCFVSISDKTDAKSPWILVDSNGEERPSANTSTIFNGASWNSTEGWISNIIPIFGNGYTIFEGAISAKDLNVQYENPSYLEGSETVITQPSYKDVPIVALNADMILESISNIRVHVFDRYKDCYITANANTLSRTYSDGKVNSVTGMALYFLDDMCSLTVKISRESSNSECKLSLSGYCGTNSVANDRFYITGIDIL